MTPEKPPEEAGSGSSTSSEAKVDVVASTDSPADNDAANGAREQETQPPAAESVKREEERNSDDGDNPGKLRKWFKENTKFSDWIQAATFVVVVAYTSVTYCAYHGSLEIAEQQHSDTLDALMNARIAGIDQNTTTTRDLIRADAANLIAQDTEKRQLRAYLTITLAAISVDAANNIQPHIQIKNSGLTPAYEVSGWGCLYVGTFRQDNKQVFMENKFPTGGMLEIAAIGKGTPKTIIGPGGVKDKTTFAFCDTTSATMRQLNAREISRLKAGTAAIYMYGRETYKDAFGEPRWVSYNVFNNDFIKLTERGDTMDTLEGYQGN